MFLGESKLATLCNIIYYFMA